MHYEQTHFFLFKVFFPPLSQFVNICFRDPNNTCSWYFRRKSVNIARDIMICNQIHNNVSLHSSAFRLYFHGPTSIVHCSLKSDDMCILIAKRGFSWLRYSDAIALHLTLITAHLQTMSGSLLFRTHLIQCPYYYRVIRMY